MPDFDLFVIGAGSGGVACARRAASYGAKVGIAESSRVGGTCVIRGCVPKKLMRYGAAFGEAIRDAAGYGWRTGEARLDFAALAEARNREIAGLEADGIIAGPSSPEKAARAKRLGSLLAAASSSSRLITRRFALQTAERFLPSLAALISSEDTTCDFPVPGGPVITVNGRVKACSIASRCSVFKGNGSSNAWLAATGTASGD